MPDEGAHRPGTVRKFKADVRTAPLPFAISARSAEPSGSYLICITAFLILTRPAAGWICMGLPGQVFCGAHRL